MNITMTIETITPKQAAELLSGQASNRNLSASLVNALSDDIANGRWQVNGETIKIDDNGRLIDGQHRCAAVIRSGKPIETFVARGLHSTTQETVDIGRVRKAGDILKIAQVANSSLVASIATALVRIKENPAMVWSGSNMPSKPAITNYVYANLDTLEVAANNSRNARARVSRINQTAYATMNVMAVEQGFSDEFEEFHDAILSGANLHPGDPRLTYRNWAMSPKPERASSWNQQKGLGIAIKALNAHIAGREIKLLRFSREELPFPRIGA